MVNWCRNRQRSVFGDKPRIVGAGLDLATVIDGGLGLPPSALPGISPSRGEISQTPALYLSCYVQGGR
ncbi:hypothetical protein B7W89_09245 [Agrobacterium tumefaciens]|nr:hypothetical protein B7W89_09245 [Agrobacterium tumefaciens]